MDGFPYHPWIGLSSILKFGTCLLNRGTGEHAGLNPWLKSYEETVRQIEPGSIRALANARLVAVVAVARWWRWRSRLF